MRSKMQLEHARAKLERVRSRPFASLLGEIARSDSVRVVVSHAIYGGQRRFLTDEADKGVRRRERPRSTWHSGPRK